MSKTAYNGYLPLPLPSAHLLQLTRQCNYGNSMVNGITVHAQKHTHTHNPGRRGLATPTAYGCSSYSNDPLMESEQNYSWLSCDSSVGKVTHANGFLRSGTLKESAKRRLSLVKVAAEMILQTLFSLQESNHLVDLKCSRIKFGRDTKAVKN